MSTTYGRLLTRPGATPFAAAALLGRLPLSMLGLGIVLVVEQRTGSFGSAGLLAAVLVLAAAVCSPLQGRAADTFGQTPVMAVCAVLFAVGMSLLLLAILSSWDAPWPHLCAALAGAASPQTGTMARARWTHLLGDERELLGSAFALEAVLDEVVFILGPVLVTVLTLQVNDAAGLALAAVAGSLGSAALALQPRTAPPRRQAGAGPRAPMPWAGLAPLLVASLGLGVLFGSTEVLVVAFSKEHGSAGAAGPILALWAAGSLVAGIAVGAVPATDDQRQRLRITLVVLAATFVPPLFITSVAWFAVAMFAAGLMIAPTLIAAVSIVEGVVPPSRLTEALTWTTTGLAVGVAPGAAVAGRIIDHQGASAGFLVPLVACVLAALVAWIATPRPVDHVPVDAIPANHYPGP
ncbi:hypothetical protein ASD11_07690 [Aeromicrobium sp. Root495]|uniref:MFS transporter n=1 Tax=Aeromicrobium sp. Root495 TaxID=1736550 RepID=UPI0006F847F1|nr:MFS transporter [Aeromicrobium sp. Root495]KQY59439.1 hypothetical protein ASD11_07690 [Aeromicrobium sp. Root495]